MASTDYDIITVGGGLGGAALAKSMAEHRARVLVQEREALQGPDTRRVLGSLGSR